MRDAARGLANIRAVIDAEGHAMYRPMPWRHIDNPYHILVSEVMLQQTQVTRVLQKYPLFIAQFPTMHALASAPTAQVIAAWQGLGYNRRALFLQRSAAHIIKHHGGMVPCDTRTLCTLPGIGEATAGALRAYIYDLPVVFIETNIRRVFIFYCFQNKKEVSDTDIIPLLHRSLPDARYREWYYALTDLGATLVKHVTHNPNIRSRAYCTQSAFNGSIRQLRGAIIRTLSTQGKVTVADLGHVTARELPAEISYNTTQIDSALHALVHEGFIVEERGCVYLKQ